MEPDDDLAFALSLADDADTISMARFRASDLHVETKPDLTPVSEADRLVESTLRGRIAQERPGEAVLGEEEGGEDSLAGSSTRSTGRATTRAASRLGDADRLRGASRRRLGARARPPLVGRARPGAFATVSDPRLGDRPARGRDLLYALDRPRAGAGLGCLAPPWLRRLLGSHARRRGRGGGRLRRSRPEDLGLGADGVLLEEAGGRFDDSVSWNGVLDVSELS